VGSAVAGALPHLRDPAEAERGCDQGSGLKRLAKRVMTPEQKKNNRRMGWTLASIAVVIFIAFMAKSALIGM
jgi:hypothetical protein